MPYKDKKKQRECEKRYRKSHPDCRKEEYKRNKDKIKNRCKKWQKENWEKHLEQCERYRRKHREKVRLATKLWSDKNKERIRFYSFNYQKRLRNSGIISIGEWDELKKEYNHTCPCCGKKEPEIKLEIDHIIPISKNGKNERRNIQPLCRGCNARKGARIIPRYEYLRISEEFVS